MTPTGGAIFFTNYGIVCWLACATIQIVLDEPLARWTTASESLYVCGPLFSQRSLLKASPESGRNDKLMFLNVRVRVPRTLSYSL